VVYKKKGRAVADAYYSLAINGNFSMFDEFGKILLQKHS
jgi:hypothetical protein